MARVVFLAFVFSFALYGLASAERIFGSVSTDGGKVGIGVISGGEFGPGSFSIGAPGSSGSKPSVQSGQVFSNVPNVGDSLDAMDGEPGQNNLGQNIYRPGRPQSGSVGSSGQWGVGGQGGHGSDIIIGAVHNKKKPGQAAVAYGTVIDGHVVSSSPDSNVQISPDGSIAIGVLSGGHFEDEFKLPAKKPIVPNKPKVPNKPNKGNTNCPCAQNQAANSLGHDADNFGYKRKEENNQGYGSDEKEDSWIWGS